MDARQNRLSRRWLVSCPLAVMTSASWAQRGKARGTGKDRQVVPELRSEPAWMTLPATPVLPEQASSSGLAQVNGIQIFCATFGQGVPVVFLHGGLANSNYWGAQVASLFERYRVIVMDTRGHGRSPLLSRHFSYATFADDVIATLNVLGIDRAHVVGWSDGAITGLQLAMNRPDRVSSLFAFGANRNIDGVRPEGGRCRIRRFCGAGPAGILLPIAASAGLVDAAGRAQRDVAE